MKANCLTPLRLHPTPRFAEDGVSFSISTDDPTVTQTTLTQEYAMLQAWGLTEAQLTRAVRGGWVVVGCWEVLELIN